MQIIFKVALYVCRKHVYNHVWCTALLTLVCIVFGLQLQLSSLKFKVFHLNL